MKQKYETIEVDFTDEQFMLVALEAHKRDITFNKMCEIILLKSINKIKV